MSTKSDDEDPFVRLMRETRGELAGLPEIDAAWNAGQSAMMSEWHDPELDVYDDVPTELVEALNQSAADLEAGRIEPLEPFLQEMEAELEAHIARKSARTARRP